VTAIVATTALLARVVEAQTNLSQNLIANGDFETGWTEPWLSVNAGQTTLPGWTVTVGNIDVRALLPQSNS
jgi:hypothetical protein